jgi:hypothetical protein
MMSAFVSELNKDFGGIESNGGDGKSREKQLPPIEDAAELISRAIVLPPDVVNGILHKGGKMVLGGASKSFKTWQLIDLATAVATGNSWMGCATVKGRVLYVNLELQQGYFTKRLKTVVEAKEITLESGTLEVWNLRGFAADLAILLPQMLAAAGKDKYSLIIIDPIYKVFGGHEENPTHHVAAVMNNLEMLAVESDAAVAFGAHFSKGNQAAKESIDRLSGSGVFARDPDSILIFTKHEEHDALVVEATLRNHPPIEPFVVEWEFPLMRRNDNLDPTRLKQPGGAPRKVTHEQMLKLLDGKDLKVNAWRERAQGDLGISESTFWRVKRELMQQDKIMEIAGFWTRIS